MFKLKKDICLVGQKLFLNNKNSRLAAQVFATKWTCTQSKIFVMGLRRLLTNFE